jgi:uncharacterized surface protein with fasciclin (FAS1) repeats
MIDCRILIAAPVAALVAACASQPAATSVSLAETIARDPQLSTLNTLVTQAGLGESLKVPGLVPVRLSASDVKNGNVKTAQGANVAVFKAGETVTVEDAMVQRADIMATNGVVHTVDRVLMPPKSH